MTKRRLVDPETADDDYVYDRQLAADLIRARARLRTIRKATHRPLTGLRVLEIGPGSGALATALEKERADVQTIEISAAHAERLRAGGLTVTTGDFSNLRPERRYDLVIAEEVLEHAINPERFLRHLLESLDEAGVALLAVPNFASLNRSLYGQRWHLFSIYHLWYFTPRSLKLLIQHCGGRFVRYRRVTGRHDLKQFVIPTVRARPARAPLTVALFAARTLLNIAGSPVHCSDFLMVEIRKALKSPATSS
jgi:2-polyprenyl-3-methyl-5-hydroxy-6-metoxy-1,4-benzoquinol methylase